MPRYMIVRAFDVTEDMMPAVGLRSRKVIEERYPEIIWEHSHVVVDDEGRVKTYCVYAAPDLDAVKAHSVDLGRAHDRGHPRDRRRRDARRLPRLASDA